MILQPKKSSSLTRQRVHGQQCPVKNRNQHSKKEGKQHDMECGQIGRFLKVLRDMVSIKSSPNAWWIFGLKWKTTLFMLNYWDYFLEKLGYFLIQHLVTLTISSNLKMLFVCQKLQTLNFGFYVFCLEAKRHRRENFKIGSLTHSVTSKSCPKMISLEKFKILTPWQKLPMNVGDLGKLIVAKGFEKLPKVQKRPIWSHCVGSIPFHRRILPISTPGLMYPGIQLEGPRSKEYKIEEFRE